MNNIDLYIVKKGDTLYNIAKRYNMTYGELMNLNNLTSTLINIGKQIIVPSNIFNQDRGPICRDDVSGKLEHQHQDREGKVRRLSVPVCFQDHTYIAGRSKSSKLLFAKGFCG